MAKFFYKILNQPPLPQEAIDLAKNNLPKGLHPGRYKSHAEARFTLKMLLEEVLKASLSWDQLELKNYHSLTQFPDWTISLSHTTEASAAVVAHKNEIKSVGIDIEHCSRVVKDDILTRISHPQDFASSSLERWCLKEACFKALSNLGLEEHNWTKIQILNNHEFFYTEKNIHGHYQMIKQGSFVTAVSYCL